MKATNKKLKLGAACVFGALALVYGLNGKGVNAFSAGPPVGRTGAPAMGSFPAELTCQGCHSSFSVNSGAGSVAVTGLPASYALGQEVTVTVTVSQADRLRYGFQATALDELGRRAGDLVVTDTDKTQLIAGTGNYAGRQYIEHTANGFAPTGTNLAAWTFKWRAPSTNVGRVTLYVAGNAANGNGNNSGDYIYITNASMQAPAASLPVVTSVSAASYLGTLAADAIGALFGSNLADSSVSATAQPLPTTLGGVQVKVKDNLDVERDASLFAVSKGQVNFLVPALTAPGTATVTIYKNSAAFASGNMFIDAIAPALFSANMNGANTAAAVLLRVKADGTRTFEPIATFDTTQSRYTSTPIDLGPDTDQLFLLFFGSGIRGNTALSNVACTIGGTSAEVLFAGAVPGFAGLDQVNVRLPRTLAGRGNVAVALTVATRAANGVSVNVK